MPYQVMWLVRDRVLYESQSGDVTLDEIRELTTQIADLLDIAYTKFPGSIVAILDMREANLSHLVESHTPAGIRRIAEAIDPRIWKARKGFTILITSRTHVQIVISLITKVFSQPITTVGSFDEALEVATTMYPELRGVLEGWWGGDPSVERTSQ
jgi:hypothetical protein